MSKIKEEKKVIVSIKFGAIDKTYEAVAVVGIVADKFVKNGHNASPFIIGEMSTVQAMSLAIQLVDDIDSHFRELNPDISEVFRNGVKAYIKDKWDAKPGKPAGFGGQNYGH